MKELKSSSYSKEAFKSVLPYPNPFTPEIIDYFESANYCIEFSKNSFNKAPIYGVTLLNKKDLTPSFKKSKSFETYEAARNYIKSLN